MSDSLNAYEIYIPLFQIADFVEMSCTICAFTTKTKANAVQRDWFTSKDLSLKHSEAFKVAFSECAAVAYSLPNTAQYDVKYEGIYDDPWYPKGIRRPFIELLRSRSLPSYATRASCAA